jgi:hydrophobe/amphiphile efflux-1 (HAE1) family protein
MSISEPFIRRPIATSLFAIGLLLLGVVAYRALPVASLPQVDFPVINVQVKYPGVDPQTGSTSLAAPLERRFANIAGVNEITSVSQMNSTLITLQFDLDRDINGVARDVQAAINATQSELPPGLPTPPVYKKANPNDFPVLILALSSDIYSSSEIYNYANELLAPAISRVSGVSEVDIGGAGKQAVRVQADPASLASLGLSIDDVRSVLSGENKDEPKGSMDGDRLSYSVNTNDQLFKAADYRNLIVAQKNGAPITLSSVAQIQDASEDRFQAAWLNSTPAVVLLIHKQFDANVMTLVDHVKATLPQLRVWLPPTIHLDIQTDLTQTIRSSVADVQIALVVSIGLVVMVCFLFLRRISTTFVACVTVPLALAGTFAMMYALHFSLDNISLMALAVSVGFVVDDAIVVIENIVRYLEQGLPPFQASLKGAQQISFTVLSISISMVAVFIPLLFMGGIVGREFHEFSVTLSGAILISAITSLTLAPMLCARFLKRERPKQTRSGFAKWTNRAFDAIPAFYAWTLRWVLRHSFLMLWVTIGTVCLTIWLYRIVPKGLFPQQDTGIIMAITEGAQDTSFDAMKRRQTEVLQIVEHDPAVTSALAALGSGPSTAGNQGRIFITLAPRNQRKENATQIAARLGAETARVPGIGCFFQAYQDISVGGRRTKGQYIYSLVSSDQQELNDYVPKLLTELKKHTELRDLTTDQQQNGLQSMVVVDRTKAGELGVEPEQIDSALYSAFGQRQVSVMYTERDQFHVVLEASPQYLDNPSALDKIYVDGSRGIVPLSAVARFETRNTPTLVNHQGQFPAVTFSFNLDQKTSLQQATRIITDAAASIHLPDDIRGDFQGTAQIFQSSLSSQPILILTALIAVYIVLGALYESFVHPITILSSLPSAGIGALLALLICHAELSIVAIIGIILLIGIVKKNAIMMIDFALEAEREQHLIPSEAIYQACIVRFRPILMTTLAAMFGAVPLAIGGGDGSEIRQPLGITIVGGLAASQLLTLYVTPVIFLYLDRLRRRTHPDAKSVVLQPA